MSLVRLEAAVLLQGCALPVLPGGLLQQVFAAGPPELPAGLLTQCLLDERVERVELHGEGMLGAVLVQLVEDVLMVVVVVVV